MPGGHRFGSFPSMPGADANAEPASRATAKSTRKYFFIKSLLKVGNGYHRCTSRRLHRITPLFDDYVLCYVFPKNLIPEMELLDSLDNFLKRTLAAVPGLWHKLAYLGGLRKDSGDYDHWGLSKRYGADATKAALGSAHEQIFLDVLRKPVKRLLEEVKENAVEKELPEAEYVEELWISRDPMTPTDLGGGSRRHFEVTLETLRSLVRRKSRPAAPPPPPPDR